MRFMAVVPNTSNIFCVSGNPKVILLPSACDIAKTIPPAYWNSQQFQIRMDKIPSLAFFFFFPTVILLTLSVDFSVFSL